MDIDRKTASVGAAVFLLMAVAGFYTVQTADKTARYDRSFNLTVSPDNDIVTASFDGNSVDILRGSGVNASFYIDYDRDGNGAEENGEITGLVRDGKIRKTSELATFNGTNYMLYFRYRTVPGEEGDWLTLYRVKRL